MGTRTVTISSREGDFSSNRRFLDNKFQEHRNNHIPCTKTTSMKADNDIPNPNVRTYLEISYTFQED